jgi:glycerol-3-phosphate dehydrogenase
VSAWAGIRPLATGRATTPGAISREHSIVADGTGIIDVTGGKLTTYRSMAAEIVDLVQATLGKERRRASTDLVELPGADRFAAIAQLQRADAELARPLVPEQRYTGAHLVYGVREEMARTLADLLIRRTHVAFETRDHGLSAAPRAADIVAPLLGWSRDEKSAQLRAYEGEVERMFSVADD